MRANNVVIFQRRAREDGSSDVSVCAAQSDEMSSFVYFQDICRVGVLKCIERERALVDIPNPACVERRKIQALTILYPLSVMKMMCW